MTFLDRAREPTETETRPLATLAGQLTFADATTPVFTGKLDDAGVPEGLVVDAKAADDAPEGASSKRLLRFEFTSPDFKNVPSSTQTLIIKLDPQRFKFMELGAKLEIAGGSEADFNVNELLDIAITRLNPPPFLEGATIGVHPPLFDEIPSGAVLMVTPSSGKPESFDFDEGLDRGDGLLHFVIPDPQPGILYTAEIRLNPAKAGAILFKDIELNQLLLESEGSALSPLPALGVDALAFESTPADPPAGQAVQGGPEETSDEQLAQFNAQSGNSAVA